MPEQEDKRDWRSKRSEDQEQQPTLDDRNMTETPLGAGFRKTAFSRPAGGRGERPDRWIYLHGFLSGPVSQRALFFRDKLAAVGIPCEFPDLNTPSFERLTVSTRLERVGDLIDSYPSGARIGIIGSDLGGLLAILAAGPRKNVRALFLMGPALSLFRENFIGLGKAGMRHWERTRHVDFYHSVLKVNRTLGWNFVQDARQYDESIIDISIPMTIVHGTSDEMVDSHHSAEYAQNRENVSVHLLEDDQSLHTSITEVWDIFWRANRPR
jgi:uncharacterized protein